MASIDYSSIVVKEGLAGAGRDVNGQAQAIADELHSLWNQLMPIAETWTGAAKDYYFGLQQEWNIAADGLFGPDGVLGEIAAVLQINWNNYSEAEWANVQTWQQHA